MKTKVIFLFILSAISWHGSSQIQTVENTFYGCEPTATFKFYTLGNTHSGQAWSDGQGNTPLIDSPTFSYSTAGNYTVSVGNLSQTITIYPKLIYNFTTDSPTVGCFPFKFNLRDVTYYPTGLNGVLYNWTYEDGGGGTGNPIHSTITNYYKYNCFVKMSVQTNSPSCNDLVSIPNFFKIRDRPIAKINANPTSSCKVPLTVVFNNLSTDSLKSTLNYLWKWNKPTPGTSTSKNPPNITFNTNLTDYVTLEVTNDVGCKSYDTVRISIDTPQLDFTVSNKVCIYDSGDLYILNPDPFNFTYEMSSSTFYKVVDVNDTLKKYMCNNRPSGYYPITLTKRSISDPTCFTSHTKLSYIVNDYPDAYLKQSYPCKTPIHDTIQVRKVTSNVDSIFYFIEYRDQYGVVVKDSFYGDKSGDLISKGHTDSNYIYTINKYNDLDSYYRKGPLYISCFITFYNKETQCRLSDTISQDKNSIFRAAIVDYQNKGCAPLKDSFKVFTYGDNRIDSIFWFFGDNTTKITKKDSQLSHTYNTSGIYRAYAIVKDPNGCVDTTNPLIIKRGDSIPPQLSLSKSNMCINDSVVVSINNPNAFDRWFFVTDNFKSSNCPNQLTQTISNYYHAGNQPIYLIAEKNGCFTKVKDSIDIKGPKFNLNFDFKCSRRDSIQFFLSDTFGIDAPFYTWDFGDGHIQYNLSDTMWHKFTGDSINYKVKVSMVNFSGCSYADSTIVKIRNVKPFFKDTLFCKQTNPGTLLNDRPYTFNPSLSRNADYLTNFQYTWSLESIAKPNAPAKKYPPYTFGKTTDVHIPLDTMNLTLIARDANGCENSYTRRIIVTDNTANFTLNFPGYCPPTAHIISNNLSSSPYGIRTNEWKIYAVSNGAKAGLLYQDTLKHLNTILNLNIIPVDTYQIDLTITDSAYCNTKTVSKRFGVFRDTSSLIIPKEICQNTSYQIASNENNIGKFRYQWYINNALIPFDTLSKLKYQFSALGKYQVKLEKQHRLFGCLKTFQDSTTVREKPRIRVDNTFDTIKNKCFPAVTKISYFDSSNVASLGFYFEHNANKTTVNPTYITLHGGINAIHTVIWTNYGCLDTIVNYDTVSKPNADISLDKTTICKGEFITFTLQNKSEVDSIHWVFGDGTNHFGIDTFFHKQYNTANTLKDTILTSMVFYGYNKSCPQSKTLPILVLESKPGFYLNNKIDTAYCHNTITVHNTYLKGDYFRWNFGDGNADTSRLPSFDYLYRLPGKYTITQYVYRSPLGCVDSIKKSLELYPMPKITATVDSVCLGKDILVYYSDTLPNTKVYITPDFYADSPYTISPIKNKISKDTTFRLISISDKGCRDTTSASAVVIKPDTLMQLDTIIEMGKFVKIPLRYNSYYRYSWSPNLPNPSCIDCSYPIIQEFKPTTYALTITDYRNCFQIQTKFIIDIYPDIKVVVPTAFTPNGDGNNDIMYARGFGIKKLLSFKIFDRHGQLLFLTTDENIGWDGSYKGVPQNTDAYFYTYEAESFIPNKIVRGDGNFMLLR